MNLKEWWQLRPYWLKFGIYATILLVYGILFMIAHNILIFNASCPSYWLSEQTNSFSNCYNFLNIYYGLFTGSIYLISIFMIGAFIGLIYKKK